MEISFNKVSYTYSPKTPFARTALSEIDLQIQQGDYVAVIGKTGSGKSTLIQLLAGLLTPTTGTISLGDFIITPTTKKFARLRKKVGIVFQYPEHQLFDETVAKDIGFGPRNQGCSEGEITKRVTEAMEMVGLPPNIAERSPFELSGGQMRRVAIAGVLAMRPEILILDEPTAGLDFRGQSDLLSSLKLLHRKMGFTVIHVTHNMDEAAEVANEILLMNDGKIVGKGSPRDIFSDLSNLESFGLDLPEITKLILALNKQLSTSFPTDLFQLSALGEELIQYWDEVKRR